MGAAGCRAFFSGLIGKLSSIICKFLVRASRFVVKAVHPRAPPVATGPGHRVEQHVLEINLLPCRDSTDGSSRARGLVLRCMCGESARKIQNEVRISRL